MPKCSSPDLKSDKGLGFSLHLGNIIYREIRLHRLSFKVQMDPSEVEFLAEKENITIVPNFSLEKIHLISVSCFKVLFTTFNRHLYYSLNLRKD